MNLNEMVDNIKEFTVTYGKKPEVIILGEHVQAQFDYELSNIIDGDQYRTLNIIKFLGIQIIKSPRTDITIEMY